MRRQVMRIGRGVVAAAFVGVMCAACGGAPSDSGGGAAGSLSAAVGRLGDSGPGQLYVEFGDTAAQRRLAPQRAFDSPFREVSGYGAYRLAMSPYPLIEKTGIDPSAAATVVTVGMGAGAVTVLDGSFDAAAVGAKLGGLGYHSVDRGGGRTDWAIADNRAVSPAGPSPFGDIAIGDFLNVVRVSPTQIAYGGATADIDAVLGHTTPLSAKPAVTALAQCLGSPVAALVADTGTPSRPIALGAVATSAADEREVLCAATPDQNAATSLAAAMPQHLQTAATAGGRPWSQLLTDAHVEVLGGSAHIVRVTAHSAKAGVLLNQWAEGGVNNLLGLPTF